MFHAASVSHSIGTIELGSEHAATRLIADADTGPPYRRRYWHFAVTSG